MCDGLTGPGQQRQPVMTFHLSRAAPGEGVVRKSQAGGSGNGMSWSQRQKQGDDLPSLSVQRLLRTQDHPEGRLGGFACPCQRA